MNKIEEVLKKLNEMEAQFIELKKVIKDLADENTFLRNQLKQSNEEETTTSNNFSLSIDEIFDYEFVLKNCKYQALITRAKNLLARNGIKYLRDFENTTMWNLYTSKDSGPKTMAFIIVVIESYGMYLEDDLDKSHETISYSPTERRRMREKLINLIDEFRNNIIF